jgi:NDP-sugar pyrophosphorylase family protein
MNAMILAAGFGTRLGKLTDALPKPLVPVAGRPMIAHVMEALAAAGCSRIIVNIHHHADAMAKYLSKADVGAEVIISREERILGTGGGILNARGLLRSGPFIVHNADIFSRLDLDRLIRHAAVAKSTAVLALRPEQSDRPLVFDRGMNFLGKQAWETEGVTYPPDALRFGFTGIHIIDPDLFFKGQPVEFCDVFDIYRSLVSDGARISGLVCDGFWTDLGTPGRITACERYLAMQSGAV